GARADPGQAIALPGADLLRVLRHPLLHEPGLPRADPRLRPHAADADAAVRVHVPGARAADLDAGQHTRGGGAGGDGDDDAVDLPVGLCVPAGFDAGGVLLPRADLPDDVADRRGPRGDPARGWLARAVGALAGALGHGRGGLRAGNAEVQEAANVESDPREGL